MESSKVGLAKTKHSLNKLNQNYDQERIQMNPRVQTANYNQDNFFQDMSRDSASYAMSMWPDTSLLAVKKWKIYIFLASELTTYLVVEH